MPGFIADLDFFRSDGTTGFTIRRPGFSAPNQSYIVELRNLAMSWVVHIVMGKFVLGQEQFVGLEQP